LTFPFFKNPYKTIPFVLFLCLSCQFFSEATLGLAETNIPAAVQVRLDALVEMSASEIDPGERIRRISQGLLGRPYRADTLVGGPEVPERLVVRLDAFDCLTFLETVEALRRSRQGSDFRAQLRDVRYFGGVVSYPTRRHFFSDWIQPDAGRLQDVTSRIGGARVRSVVKQLNRKSADALWLAGLPVTTRTIHYIPAELIDAAVLAGLQDGDYVGFYTEQPGLDVSHTGLIVENDEAIMLRHASSRRDVARVVDEDLVAYLHNKPGLIIYRAMQ
jgi:hypothetical protein